MKAQALHIRNMDQKLFTILSIVIGLTIALHVYFVVSMAVYASERQSLAREASTVRSAVSELEAEYLSMSKNIDLAFAYKEGYVRTDDVTFAHAQTVAQHSAGAGNEI